MKEPIYKIIVDKLKKDIQNLQPNIPIVSEREFAKSLNISRVTVRKAINILIEEGYLYRDGNKGTFIADKKIHKMNNSINFKQKVEELKHRIIYFSVKNNVCEEDILKFLDVQDYETIVRIVRENSKDSSKGQVIVNIEEIYVVYKRVDYNLDISEKDMLHFEKFIDIERINQKFIPMIVPMKYANLIGISMDTPIILIETIIFNKRAIPIAFIRTYNNPKEKDIMIIT